jgi:hypothetical protein
MISHNYTWQRVKPHIDYFVNMQAQLDSSLSNLQEQAVAMFESVAMHTHPDFTLVLVPKDSDWPEPQERIQRVDPNT